jgi:hypothetical protein
LPLTTKKQIALIEKNARAISREAFELFAKLITAQLDDPERKRVGNESLIADLLGEDPVPIPRTSLVDPKVAELLHRFIHLRRVPDNFAAMETMAKSYPWKGKISRAQHLEHCYLLIAHETYILEERLKRFLNSVSACAADRPLGVDMKAITKGIIKVHADTFGSMVAARGVHVHQTPTVPREIERIGLLELLNGSPFPGLTFFHREAVKKARKQVVAHADNARRNAEVLIAAAVHATKPVWDTVAREELNKFSPKNKPKRRKPQPASRPSDRQPRKFRT